MSVAGTFEEALYAALQRLPDTWLPPEVTRFDIGLTWGSSYSFREFLSALPELGRVRPDVAETRAAGAF